MSIIGIDLGTTNSAVSVYELGNARTLKLKGKVTTPSVVWVNPEGDFVVGNEAKQHVAVDPEHILISTKRDLGSDKKYIINGEEFTPTETASIILRYLANEASKTLGEAVNDVVVTVPAYFGFTEIAQVKKAAIDAGLNPLAVMPEPTAAALRYGIEIKNNQYICVVDLGGGTFDVTVLHIYQDKKNNNLHITPVGVDGDHYLGGDDFDNLIIDWLVKKGASNFRNRLELKSLAETAKIELADLPETEISHPVYLPNPVTLTRKEYENMIKPYLEQIGETIKKTVSTARVEDSPLTMDDINRFVLVGGSCKHPLVRDYVEKIVGRKPYSAPNLDTFVAEGAAIYHHSLKTPSNSITLINITPKSLGTDLLVVDNNEKINAIILEQGTVLPARGIQMASFGGTHLFTSVLEGSERAFDKNKLIDTIEIDLPPVEDYLHSIFTEFLLDESGVLSFNTYTMKVTDKTVSEIAELSQHCSGDANLLDPEVWDQFKARHTSELKSTPKELKIEL